MQIRHVLDMFYRSLQSWLKLRAVAMEKVLINKDLKSIP